MINKNIEEIIIKFLNRSLTSKELDYLNEWILNPKNEMLFEDYIKSHFEITMGMNEPDIESIKEKLFNEISNDRTLIYRIKSNPFYRYAAAASVLLIIALTVFLNNGDTTIEIEQSTIVNTNPIEPGTDKATLTLEDGSQIALEKGGSFQTQNANSNGEQIIYKGSPGRKMAYNTLTIPRGGQFHIVLSDGTQVWLNSETQLKYPISFKDGETRQVELEYGEAYFDVSPSLEHNGAKFKVFNQSQEIEVLGTEFNIKAYKDESNIYTTLVEGKVEVSFDGKKQNLIPSQQSNLNILNNTVVVAEVDVYSQISWKEGLFTFEGKPLKDIVKVLSRWYDVDFIFEDKASEEKRFNGSLNRKLKINEILDIIKNFGKIKGYEINEKTIVIK